MRKSFDVLHSSDGGLSVWLCEACGARSAPTTNPIQRCFHDCRAGRQERADDSRVAVLRDVDRGPGTELHDLLESLGITDYSGCQCRKRMREMNAWGVAGCREHRAEIITWLKEAAAERGWGAKFDAALALCKQPWWTAFDRYGSIVDEAIRRAEAKARIANRPTQG